MKKLYIGVDGVLLTVKNTRVPPGAVEFINYITSAFDCYWLTTRLKGNGEVDTASLLRDLALYYDVDTLKKLQTIKPASWETAKTEGIDFDADFYWIDDYPFEYEKKILEAHHKLDRLITVDVSHHGELIRVKEWLQANNVKQGKYLFLDIDGVLNTGRYYDYLIDHHLDAFDEDGAIFDLFDKSLFGEN